MSTTPPDSDWESLIRSSPDPSAPSTPREPLATLYNVAFLILFALGWPLLFVYWAVIKVPLNFPTSREKGSRLLTWFLAKSIKMYTWRHAFFIPPVDYEESIIPIHQRIVGHRGVTVVKLNVPAPPDTPKWRRGVAQVPDVHPVPRPAFMLTPPSTPEATFAVGLERARPAEHVICYLVGGAYEIGHPLESMFPYNMSYELGVRVFCLNYRKALDPQSSWPAQLFDSLGGWLYLTETLGFQPENICMVGDSAGGHLCVSLTRYLAERECALPGSLGLSSPWVDLTMSLPSIKHNHGKDFVVRFCNVAVPSTFRHYVPEFLRHPYVSPALSTPKDWLWLANSDTVVVVHGGTDERLIDEIRLFVDVLDRADVKVTYVEEEGGLHVMPVLNFPGTPSWGTFRSLLRPLVAPDIEEATSGQTSLSAEEAAMALRRHSSLGDPTLETAIRGGGARGERETIGLVPRQSDRPSDSRRSTASSPGYGTFGQSAPHRHSISASISESPARTDVGDEFGAKVLRELN